MRAPTSLVAAATLLLAACGGGSGPSSDTPTITLAPAPTDCSVVQGQPSLRAVVVASGLAQPLDFQVAPGDARREFVVEQPGRIRVIRDGALIAEPFLDITDRTSTGGERGLLGLAFHPGYANNGRLFVNYTDAGGTTRIVEFLRADPDHADPGSERLLLEVAQPFSNHNGGALAFGPHDGYLYVALGDGGSGGDPMGHGQNRETLLGSILRLDVRGDPYAVPASNPFVGMGPRIRPQIWAYGLRNPWRIAFDSANGDLYIADVGQNAVEEIDVGRAEDGGGENYGWNVMEGSRCFRPATGCDPSGLTPPVVEYSHAEGCSVTGGVVYRGCRMPGYQGTYFYADFCSGFVRSFRLVGDAVTEPRDWTQQLGDLGRIAGFGVDARGEMHVLDLGGRVFRIEPAGG